MRVMMVGPFPGRPDKIDGGVASAITYLSRALIAEPGIDLVGIRISPAGVAARSDDFGWPMRDLPLGRFSLTTLYRRQRERFQALLEEFRPDVVHGQGTDLAGLLAVSCGLPAVVTVHGLLGECAKHQTATRTKMRAMLSARLTEHSTVRRTRELIAISPYVERYYGSDISGRIHTIPNAVAPAFFDLKRTPERGRLLFAGRISQGKGVLELVRALAKARDCVSTLVLAGATPDPVYERLVRAEVERSSLERVVRFAGLLSEADLLGEFAVAEALVLPSFQETAPMVVQQAMAAGLPVVATDVGGVPYQIRQDESGLLVAPGDVEALSAAFRRLRDEPSLAARLSLTSRRIAGSLYRPESVAAATVAVYRAATAGAHRRLRHGAGA